MSVSMQMMWFSISGMVLMAIAALAIYVSRYKLKGFFKYLVGTIAYFCLLLAGIIMFITVVSGPTGG